MARTAFTQKEIRLLEVLKKKNFRLNFLIKSFKLTSFLFKFNSPLERS